MQFEAASMQSVWLVANFPQSISKEEKNLHRGVEWSKDSHDVEFPL